MKGGRGAFADLLHGEKLVDHVFGLAAECFLFGGRIGKGQGGQKVSGGVPPKETCRFLPASRRQCVFGVETKGPAEIVEHPVRIEKSQIVQSALLVFREHAAAGKLHAVRCGGCSLFDGRRAGKGSRRQIGLSGQGMGIAGQYGELEFPNPAGRTAACREGENHFCMPFFGCGPADMAFGIHTVRIAAFPCKSRSPGAGRRQRDILRDMAGKGNGNAFQIRGNDGFIRWQRRNFQGIFEGTHTVPVADRRLKDGFFADGAGTGPDKDSVIGNHIRRFALPGDGGAQISL